MTAGDIRVRQTRVRRMRVQTRDGDHQLWHSLHNWLYKRDTALHGTKFTICWYISLA